MPLIIRSDGSQVPGKTESPADHVLTFAPCDLSFIRIDHQTRLQFGNVEVVIETRFHLEAGRRRHDLDPEDRGALGPLLALYPTSLTVATVGADGTLTLGFAGGASIAVPPHPSYEPWQISGPGTALIVCGEGNPPTLSVWA
ncbi:MAG: DUF6188 family protein [Acidimicrobiales bacterium]